MTISIDSDTRTRALQPSPEERKWLSPLRLAVIVGCGSAVLGFVGAASMAWAFATHEWRAALLGTTLMLLAGMGATVLCLRAMLAARQEFYRRGQLDGWRRGWTGEPPEVSDPLLR